MIAHNDGLNTLDQSIPDPDDYALALRHAPRIRFDTREPFMPSVVGYTVFRDSGPSPSFPRDITLNGEAKTVIEYAIWWDWDIQHLYELEHIWVWLDENDNVIASEASWHGGLHPMVDENGNPPMEHGRVTVYSESGKHAFAPSPAWLLERAPRTRQSCGPKAGRMGVLVTPLFEGKIASRTPLANRAVHSYLQCHAFEPSFEYNKVFDLESVVHVPWAQLQAWIPQRVAWWADELVRTLPPNRQHLYNIAHRGASAYAPENSLDAFRKAAEMGSDLVEVDIRFTADGVAVVTHDQTLKRVYGINGAVSDLTLEELYAITPEGMARVPTFEEVAAICHELQLGLYLDIKEVNLETTSQILETLKRYGLLKYSIAGSFVATWVADIKAMEPNLFTSILFGATNVDPVALAKSVQCDYVHPCWERRAMEPHKLLTPEWIKRVHDAGLGIVCWHEERPSEIAALRALGVDAICSDMPDLLATYPAFCD